MPVVGENRLSRVAALIGIGTRFGKICLNRAPVGVVDLVIYKSAPFGQCPPPPTLPVASVSS